MIKWRKKSKTIQTLLTFNRKNRSNRGKFYTHLHDWSLSWIGQVTSIEIDDVKLVLCSQASLVSEMMRHVCVSYVSKMIPLTCYLSISIVGGTYLYIVSTRAMVLNAIFNKIAVISLRSFLLLGESAVPGENHWFLASNWYTLSHNVYRVHIAWRGFGLKTLFVIDTDWIGYKSNEPISVRVKTVSECDEKTNVNCTLEDQKHIQLQPKRFVISFCN